MDWLANGLNDPNESEYSVSVLGRRWGIVYQEVCSVKHNRELRKSSSAIVMICNVVSSKEDGIGGNQLKTATTEQKFFASYLALVDGHVRTWIFGAPPAKV